MTIKNLWQRVKTWWRGDYDDSALYIGATDQVPDHQFKDLTRRLREQQEAARDALGERHLLHPSHSPKRRKPRKLGAPKPPAKAKRATSKAKRKTTPRGTP
jgi:hypothetical protein